LRRQHDATSRVRIKSSLAFLRQHVLPASLCFALALTVATTELFHRVDNVTLDQLTKLRAQLHPTPPLEELMLIGIDETSLKDYGRWPWDREVHGRFLQLLSRVKPAVISWDVLFPESSPQDGEIIKGLLRSDNVVIFGAMRAEVEEGVQPGDPSIKDARLTPLLHVSGDVNRVEASKAMLLPAGPLAKIAGIGFVDTPPDTDGVRRNAPLLVRIGDQIYPTLSLRSLMEYWRASADQVSVRLGEAIIIDAPLGRRRIPIDESGAYRINYRHSLDGFPRQGYSTVASLLDARYFKKQDVQVPDVTARILLIGQVADGLADFGPTPFSPLTPLMLVHANVIENVIREDYVRFIPPWTVWLGGFIFSLVGLVRFSDRKLREQAVFSLGIPVAYGMVAAVVWINGSWLMPVVGPVSGFAAVQIFMIGRRVLLEQRAKEQIKGMFGTYVSPQLVARMIDAGEMPQLGGHEENITAYFSDIQSFSTFSELMPPDRLVELMNEYLTACTDIVQEEGGTLDKYIGDAVVAMFGAPIALSNHAYRACVATQRVQQRLGELRDKWKSEGDRWPEIVWRMQSRIGLNSGMAVVGNMGSRTRFNYTMMGDNVNLAARMESGAKSWGAYVMCTEVTKLACEEHGPGRVIFRPLGRIVVKGRSQAVPIYEIMGLKETIPAEAFECLGVFGQALEKYYARDWDAALKLFNQASGLEINIPGKTPGVVSNPSLVYTEITQTYKDEPPPASWDGVYHMKEK
jgi:adenylate cyclase